MLSPFLQHASPFVFFKCIVPNLPVERRKLKLAHYHRPQPQSVLAAAKRSGRARGRSTGRGRARSTEEDRPANANGTPTAPAFSFAAASGSGGDDGRRVELLRRLNQITQQRYRLERRASRESAKGENGSNGHPSRTSHQASPSALPRDAKPVATGRRRKTPVEQDSALQKSVKSSRRHADRDVVEVNGGKGKHGGLPKRRRGDTHAESSGGDGTSRRGSSELYGSRVQPGQDRSRRGEDDGHAQRNGKHHHAHAKRRDRSSAGKEKEDMRIDLDSIGEASRTAKIDLMLPETSSGKLSQTKTPPTTPPLGTRGSARVRTPSVLLSSHPGEKVPSLQKSAASKNKQVAFCLRIVKDMLRLKDAFGFSKPIDQLWSVDQLPGYFEMITHPMDLDTVRKRLESGYYLSTPGKAEVEEVTFDVAAFSADMRLIFKNAQTYNRAGDIFYDAATRLLEKFESRMKQMPSAQQIAAQTVKKNKKRKKSSGSHGPESDKRTEASKRRKSNAVSQDWGSNGPPRQSGSKKKASAASSGKQRSSASGATGKNNAAKSDTVEPSDADNMSVQDMEARLRALRRQRTLTKAGSPASSPAAGGASYMAQAQALYHVEMSYEEKVQLSENVSKLPTDKLNKIVALAAKNKSSRMEVNNNEEIELDIESMNNQTLREMEAYVNQILFRKKGLPGNGPNADIFQMSHAQVLEEIAKVTDALRKRTKGTSKELMDEDASDKRERSFYDSDSSSDSGDSEGSGSSADESSSDESDSSGDESDAEQMRRRRERNLAHQQAMQASGTPLPSPPYQASGRS